MSSSSEITSLKLSFNGEIRRLSVSSESFTYDELVKTTLRIFPNLAGIQFSWVDDENDKVVIDSDDELFEALRVMTMEKKGYLRFEVSAKSSESDTTHTNTTNDITATAATIPIAATAMFGTIVHEGVECDQCGQNPITGTRFKCTVRKDYDLCETCERKGQHPYPSVKIYSPNQVPAAILAVVDEQKGCRGHGKGTRNGKHRGVTCDECHSRNFTGYRYKCSLRPNFDLCGTCEAKEVQPFAMIKFYWPSQLKSIEVIPNEEMGATSFTDHLDRDDSSATSQQEAETKTKTETKSTTQTQTQTQRHAYIRCNECGVKPIVGVRYQCSERPDYNLCSSCEEKGPQQFPMLKIHATAKSSQSTANVFDHMQMGVSNSLGWFRGEGGGEGGGGGGRGNPAPSWQDKHQSNTRGGGGRGSKKWLRQSELEDKEAEARLEEELLDMCIQESLEDRDRLEREMLSKSMMSDVTAGSRSSWGASSSSSVSSSASTGSGRSLQQLVASSSSSSSSGGSCSGGKSKTKVKLMARFVQDVTMPDGSQAAPCSTFYKTWRVRNDGPCDWPEGCHLVTAGGDVLIDPRVEGSSEAFRQRVSPTPSGEEVDITVELFAPSATGRHVGYFRLEGPAPECGLFGQRLWSDIRVTDADMTVSATLSPWQVVQPDGESTADETEEEDDDGLRNAASSIAHHYAQQKKKQQQQEDEEEETETSEMAFVRRALFPGCSVILHGLQKRPELNGLLGICRRWEEEAGRWEVKLLEDLRLVMLQPCNLAVCGEEEEGEKKTCLDDEHHDVEDNVEEEEEALLKQVMRDGRQEEQQEEQEDEEQEEEQQEEEEKDEGWTDNAGDVPVSMTQAVTEEELEMERWSSELEVLREMGFEDMSVLLPLLQRHISRGEGVEEDGLQAVVLALLSEP